MSLVQPDGIRHQNSAKDAFKCLPLPPMGCAGHNCVHLLATYRSDSKGEKTKATEEGLGLARSPILLTQSARVSSNRPKRQSF